MLECRVGCGNKTWQAPDPNGTGGPCLKNWILVLDRNMLRLAFQEESAATVCPRH